MLVRDAGEKIGLKLLAGEAGTSREMKASDSPNASTSTIGAAQTWWSRTKAASARTKSSIL
mgnify:CR=1 FL=1